MPYPRTGLLAEGRKCPCKPRTFNHIRPKLVFRGPNQECSHNTNEIRALRPELVFREVPGELVQWGRQTQRFRWVALCLALLEPVRRRVVQVPAPPVRLRLLAGVSPGTAAVRRHAAGLLLVGPAETTAGILRRASSGR